MKRTDNTAAAILAKFIYSPEYILPLAGQINPQMFGSDIAVEIATKVLDSFNANKYYTIQQFQDEYSGLADEWLMKPASPKQIEPGIDFLRNTYEANQTLNILKAGMGKAKDGDYLDAQTYVETELVSLRQSLTIRDTKGESIKAAIEYTNRLFNTVPGNRVVGVDTGFAYLNGFTAGWQPKTMNVIAARPGIGKTTVCCQNAVVAATQNTPVIYFTAGDSGAEMIYFKMACILADVDPGRVRINQLSDQEKKAIHSAFEKLYDLPIKVIDNAGFNGKTSGISSIVRKDALQWEQPGVVFIDYIQQINPDRNSNNRVEDIRMVSAAIQRLCKIVNCPFVVASQLSRTIEGEKRYPRNSDLRGSGDIEQDADMIIFLVRRPEDDRPIMYITKDRQGGNIPTEIEMIWRADIGRYEYTLDKPTNTQFPTASKAEPINITRKINPDEEELPF
jgi:replicative DNA helicase